MGPDVAIEAKEMHRQWCAGGGLEIGSPEREKRKHARPCQVTFPLFPGKVLLFIRVSLIITFGLLGPCRDLQVPKLRKASFVAERISGRAQPGSASFIGHWKFRPRATSKVESDGGVKWVWHPRKDKAASSWEESKTQQLMLKARLECACGRSANARD